MTSSVHPVSIVRIILTAGVIAGVLDITDAFVFNGLRGVGPIRILQFIASGVLGPGSFRGGWRTAALGLTLHFLIALTAAAAYYLASRKFRFLRDYSAIAGMLYGGVVYLVMNYVVLPLSNIPKSTKPPTLPVLINGVLAIVLLVGLPIGFITRRR